METGSCILLILIMALLVGVWFLVRRSNSGLTIVVELPVDATKEQWQEYLIYQRGRFKFSARLWKILFRSLLITSALCASVAAVLPSLEQFWGVLEIVDGVKDRDGVAGIAAVFAAAAGLLTTSIGVLKCEENFQINRRQRYEIEELLVQLSQSETTTKVVSDRIIEIFKDRGSRE